MKGQQVTGGLFNEGMSAFVWNDKNSRVCLNSMVAQVEH